MIIDCPWYFGFAPCAGCTYGQYQSSHKHNCIIASPSPGLESFVVIISPQWSRYLLVRNCPKICKSKSCGKLSSKCTVLGFNGPI